MSQHRAGLFRPGKGQVISQYTNAFAEATVYPADFLALTTTATSGQGPDADGVLEGETLGSEDFVYATLADRDSHEGLQLGVCMGSGIGAVSDWADVQNDSVAADSLIAIQCWGIHPQARTNGNAAAGEGLFMDDTNAGEAIALPFGSTLAADDTTDVGVVNVFFGVAMDTDANYSRAGASDETGSAAFVRCNF